MTQEPVHPDSSHAEPAPKAEDMAVELSAHEIAPARPLKAAWLAGPETFKRIGRILHPLAIGLMDELVRVNIFIPEGGDEREVPNLPLDIVHYNRMNWGMFRTKAITALAAEIQNRQVDLLHALDASAADLTRRIAAMLDKPYVVSSYQLGDARRLNALDVRARAVIAASQPILLDLRDHKVLSEDRLHLVRPGVYQVNHATCFTDSQKSIAIVAGGEMNDYIAYEAVLKAFGEIRGGNYDCAFFIIASGREEDRIRLAAERMGLNPRLTFVERQQATQLQGILKAADIFISPVASSHVDIASLLAMAAGDTVLAAHGRVDDFFLDGQTALLFNGGNAAELTAKLRSVLDDQAAATRTVESALGYLRENHSAARMVGQVAGIYRIVVNSFQMQPV